MAMTHRIVWLLSAPLALALALAGCSVDNNRPKLGKVSGKVTYKGKPLTAGEVLFTPARNKGGDTGQVATGQIDSDGSYVLTTFDTGDGAVLGTHKVTVISREGGDMEKLNRKPDGTIAYVLPKSAIPKKYSQVDSTPLTYTVTAEGKTIDIDLKD
jgi:hypothetical protein